MTSTATRPVLLEHQEEDQEDPIPSRTLQEWANGLGSADAPQRADSVEHSRKRGKEPEEMSWELRTVTAGPVREYDEVSLPVSLAPVIKANILAITWGIASFTCSSIDTLQESAHPSSVSFVGFSA
jgi:hypothetical protein